MLAMFLFPTFLLLFQSCQQMQEAGNLYALKIHPLTLAVQSFVLFPFFLSFFFPTLYFSGRSAKPPGNDPGQRWQPQMQAENSSVDVCCPKFCPLPVLFIFLFPNFILQFLLAFFNKMAFFWGVRWKKLKLWSHFLA